MDFLYDREAGVLLAEAENRIRNLMWTVSGDYALDVKLDLASFHDQNISLCTTQ